jgi:predicted O-methyltransferase YrrM
VEQAVRLLKRGGMLIVNDALDHDRVSNLAIREESTTTLRKVGKAIRENDQLVSTILPTGDGLLLAVKR